MSDALRRAASPAGPADMEEKDLPDQWLLTTRLPDYVA